MNFANYFLQDNGFTFINEVRGEKEPWDILAKIPTVIEKAVNQVSDSGTGNVFEHCDFDTLRSPSGEEKEVALTVKKSFILSEPLCLHDNKIVIGEGTFLESGAIIKGNCIIGKDCEIRQGAYLRGNVITGNGCVIGHASEVKNSIFMDDSHAGHFAYVGDSVLGRHVNLGAGTKLANLQFRTRSEIDENKINEIILRRDKTDIKTDMSKLGAVIGDYSEIGCNTVTSPCTLLSAHCWVYPNTCLPKGFYSEGSIIKNKGGASVDVLSRPL